MKKFDKAWARDIALALYDYPLFQLRYIENIVNNEIIYQNQETKDNKEMLARQIQLLCQLKRSNVVEILKNPRLKYPHEQCLIICKEYKNNKATAYLLERVGQCREAI